MKRSTLALALAATVAAIPIHAAPFTYHGELMDGDAPAHGAYDLRVRTFASKGAKAALGDATELLGVQVKGGAFALEVDLPENPLGDTYVEVAVRKAGTGEKFDVLGTPQPLSKANTGCWALDGNSGAPSGSFLGHAEASRVLAIKAPNGVVVNFNEAPLTSAVDLFVAPKSEGDGHTDLVLSPNGGGFTQLHAHQTTGDFTLTAGGNLTFNDGVAAATQNNGQPVHTFSGRIGIGAVGTAGGDTSGGVWFNDEATNRSFVGRGNNSANWTGFFADNLWRVVAPDEGGLIVNRTSFLSPLSDDFVVAARPAPADADADLVLLSRNGNAGTILVRESTGNLELSSSFTSSVVSASPFGVLRNPAGNALEVGGNASKTTAGDWLANSDRRIKSSIEPIPHALDTLLKLRPVTFRYDAAYRAANKGLDAKRYYNVIAQEFAEVFPDAVKGSGEYLPGKAKTPENEILQVDTYPAQITAIAAIQELAVEDDALRSELERVQSENTALREQLDSVLARLSRIESRSEH